MHCMLNGLCLTDVWSSVDVGRTFAKNLPKTNRLFSTTHSLWCSLCKTPLNKSGQSEGNSRANSLPFKTIIAMWSVLVSLQTVLRKSSVVAFKWVLTQNFWGSKVPVYRISVSTRDLLLEILQTRRLLSNHDCVQEVSVLGLNQKKSEKSLDTKHRILRSSEWTQFFWIAFSEMVTHLMSVIV